MITKSPVSDFITKYYKHFNAAALVDAAKEYKVQLDQGSKMLVSLAGALSTAELGKIFAEMIRQDKVHVISCTGANLEEDLMNLVAHSHYKRIPEYRDLTPEDEWKLLEGGLNRVTDTCIPEEEAFRRLQKHIFRLWKEAEEAGERYLPHEFMCFPVFLSPIMRSTSGIPGCTQLPKRTYLWFVLDGKTVPWGIFLLPMSSKGSFPPVL